MKRVAVIGGGLAGIAAALRLIDHGIQPILIESKKRLGGRATSFVDPRSGHIIDNCQHVLLGCCTNLIDLYSRLGVIDQIDWHQTLYWTAGRGQIDRMKAGLLPAPFHLMPSFRRMKLLSGAEKQMIGRAMWRMIRMGSTGRVAWMSRTFDDFLSECSQSPDVVRKFWNPIVVSACNLDVHRVGAGYALHVFQDGFLANRWSYTMGLSRMPLADLYAPAIDAIIDAGGDMQLGISAKAIAYDGTRVTGVITDEGVIESAAVISAVPFDRLEKLTSEVMRRADRRLQCLDRFECSPILGVHLYFEQPIMELPHLVVIDPPHGVQWLFDKGVARDSQLHHVHAVISAADEWMMLDEDEIVRRVVEDVHFALPNAIGLQPAEARAIKERRATFAAAPGVDAIRPSAAAHYAGGGGIENLYLAGDWTDTGWPATMEGAVRSGYAAAAALSGETNHAVITDVPPGLFARILGLR
jgi:squalene-associated FAD-dependent desaturase